MLHRAPFRVAPLAGALLAVILVAAAWAPAARAHAGLRASTPAEGSVVSTPPAEVELHFSAAVSADRPDAVKVFAPDGSEVSTGPTQARDGGKVVVQKLSSRQKGTHAVAYRVTSEDGHTITGSMVFHIGKMSSGAPASQRLGEDAARINRSTAVAFGVSRFFTMVCLLAAVGGAGFALLVAPSWRPRWLLVALTGVLLGAASSIVLNSAIVHGSSIAEAADLRNLRHAIRNPFGSATLVLAAMAVLALAPAAVLRQGAHHLTRSSRLALVLVFAGLGASFSLAGHAAATPPVAVRLPLDMLHVLAAAAWLGGLLQLLALAPSAGEHVRHLRRFASLALTCVLILLATGVVAALIELELEPRDLVDTQYGRIVLAKLLLFAGTMPLAWLNKSTYVPAIERRPELATHLLRQYVWRELFLLVAIVAVTAWLIGSDPNAGSAA